MTRPYSDSSLHVIAHVDNNNLKKNNVTCCNNKKCLQDLTSEKPLWLDSLMTETPAPISTQLDHAWNPDDHSENIFIKKDDPFTLHRQPVAKSTDACRGRRGISKGLHVWKITWSRAERGTDAVVGVATEKAPLHCDGYHGLVGGVNDQSWGWDIVRLCSLHNCRKRRYPSCPHSSSSGRFPGLWSQDDIPDVFFMALDMEEGTLSFVVNGRFLGHAFTGLRGRTLFPIISSVWGHGEVTLTYVNGRDPQPLPLLDICRRSIREKVIAESGAKSLLRLNDLRYPIILKNFLIHRCSFIDSA